MTRSSRSRSFLLLLIMGVVSVVAAQEQQGGGGGGDREITNDDGALLRDQQEVEEYKLDMVLEPSASKIHGLSISITTTTNDNAEAEKEDDPSITIDLSDLDFSFFDNLNEESKHVNKVEIEYAVIPVPQERDYHQEKAGKATSIITVGQCDEGGCDFLDSTDILVEGGIGAKVPSSSSSASASSYLWCYNDRKTSRNNHPDLLGEKHSKFANLIGGGGGGVGGPSLPYYYDNLKLQGGDGNTTKQRIPIDDAKIHLSEQGSVNLNYIIVFANCGENIMDINGDPVNVKGTIKIRNNKKSNSSGNRKHQSSSDESSSSSSSSSSAKVSTSAAAAASAHSGQTIYQSATAAKTTPTSYNQQQQLKKKYSQLSTEESSPSVLQSLMAPLILFGLLGGVLFLKEKEGRDIYEEDAYNASNRNAGYKSLPMMDLTPPPPPTTTTTTTITR